MSRLGDEDADDRLIAQYSAPRVSRRRRTRLGDEDAEDRGDYLITLCSDPRFSKRRERRTLYYYGERFFNWNPPPMITVGPDAEDAGSADRCITVIGDGLIGTKAEESSAGPWDIAILFRGRRTYSLNSSTFSLFRAPLTRSMYVLLRFLEAREQRLQECGTNPLPETRITFYGPHACRIEVNGVDLLHVPVDPRRTQLPRFLRDRELGLRGTDRRFVRQGVTIAVDALDTLWPLHWQQTLWRACEAIWEYMDRVRWWHLSVRFPAGVDVYTDFVILPEELHLRGHIGGDPYRVLLRAERRASIHRYV